MNPPNPSNAESTTSASGSGAAAMLASRRRLLTGGASSAVLLSVASTPVMGASCVPASRMASMHASGKVRDTQYVCTSATLSTMREEPLAALDAVKGKDAKGVGDPKKGIDQLRLGDAGTGTGLSGFTANQLDFLNNYRQGSWVGFSSLARFNDAIGALPGLKDLTLLEVAFGWGTGPLEELGQYLLTGLLNVSSTSGAIPAVVLNTAKIQSIAAQFVAPGYFQPTPGVQWNAQQTVAWLRDSVGIRLA